MVFTSIPRGGLQAPVRLATALPGLVLAACGAAAFAWHAARPVLPDVGWFAVLAGKWLDGARPYVDTVEVNLPASTLLYVPVVAAERITGLPLSVLLAAAMTALALASAFAVLRLAAALPDGPAPLVLAAALGFVLLVMPLGAFGQREHVALCLVLPALVALARRAQAVPVPGTTALLAGIAAGAALAIKPHFALVLALPAIVTAWQARSWRPLVAPELVAAALAGAVLLALSLAPHPQFFAWLPVFDATYRANRLPWLARLADPGSIAMVALISATAWVRVAALATLPRILLLAAAGFWATSLEQGKMWENHQYPGLALAVLAFALAAAPAGARLRQLALVGGSVGTVLGFIAVATRGADSTGLAGLIRERAPAHPLLFQVGVSVAAGHPLTDLVGGRWANTSIGAFIWQFADHRMRSEDLDPATRRRLETYAAADRERFRTDLLRARPDALLVERNGIDWLAWAREDEAVAAVLDGYGKAGESAGVELWLPRPPGHPRRSTPELAGLRPALDGEAR
jgi:hypothetical protein